jgi:kumamolisin
MGHSFKNSLIIAGAQLLVLILVLHPALLPAQTADTLPVPLAGSIQEIAAITTPASTRTPPRPHLSRATLTAAEGAASMDIEVVLKLRSFEELKGRIGRSEAIAREEMMDKYQPLAADYQTVLDWLTSRGFRITRADANHMAIFARATVNQIQEVLGVKFARVIQGNQEYTSAVTAPSVPSAMAPFILGINGLQPQIQPHKHIVVRPSSLTSSAPPYLPIQLATAYNANGPYGANLTGAGQTIALVTDSFPNTNDLQLFWSSYGVNQSLGNLSFIQVFSGPVPAPTGEETLDVEWSSALAPGAQVRVYASQGLALTAIDQCYAQIYNDVTENPNLGIHQMSASLACRKIWCRPRNYRRMTSILPS